MTNSTGACPGCGLEGLEGPFDYADGGVYYECHDCLRHVEAAEVVKPEPGTCSAGSRCDVASDDVFEYSDRYGIYAGRWHEHCWDRFGYEDFVFDESYAGERLEEEAY